MAANTNFRICELDYDAIRNNLVTFLKSQTEFQDYNFEGSGLDVLIRLLAYNTHYLAIYLNMLAGESFLSSAQLKNSVISRAKELGYTPGSSRAANAIVNVVVTPPANDTTAVLSIDRFTPFISQAINGVNYNFVTPKAYSTVKANGSFVFSNVSLLQGDPLSFTFPVDPSNPEQRFNIPNANIDTDTLLVSVQASSSNTSLSIFQPASDITIVQGNSQVYWLDADADGTFTVYFGDNFIGQQLSNGNIVIVSYLVTAGDQGNFANAFTILNQIGNFSNVIVQPQTAAFGGAPAESLETTRFRAPIAHTVQNRAVTKNDYDFLIAQDFPDVQSISVWGGEENNPPIYGKVFISLKPKPGFAITTAEKTAIIQDVLQNRSILTVVPEIVDPNFLFMLISTTVEYDPNKTNLSAVQLQQLVANTIFNYNGTDLETFNATFRFSKLSRLIDDTDNSILSSDTNVFLQQRFIPTLGQSLSYTLNYNVPLKRNALDFKMYSFPTFSINDLAGVSRLAHLEEVPLSFTGIDDLLLINPGQYYTEAPSVVISGDGTGANGYTTIVNGQIETLVLDAGGIDYSFAIVNLISNDGNGFGGVAKAVLAARNGTIQSFYYQSTGQKVIINAAQGTIDYDAGVVVLSNFNPTAITPNSNYPNDILTLNFQPDINTIYPQFNRILEIDPTDPSSVVVSMNAQSILTTSG